MPGGRRESVITHVVRDAKGNHTAYAGDPKTATGVQIAAGDWDKIKE